MRFRVISTSPSSEMSNTWVRVLVASERFAERPDDVLAVLADLHVTEVDHDDPADVPEPQLPGDSSGRFEVVAVETVSSRLVRPTFFRCSRRSP